MIRSLSPLLEGQRSVTWSKIRGFTLELLELLVDAPSTTTSLAFDTGETTQYVYRYLRNMSRYGLVRVEDYVWYITDMGSSLLSLTQVERRKKEGRKKVERRQKERSIPFRISSLVHGQIKLDGWLRNHSLSDCEKEVVDTLISHLNKTGTPFLYLSNHEQLSGHYDPNLLQGALQRLRQEGIIYLIRDPTFQSWKLGLKKAFIEKLRYLQIVQDLRGQADT